MFASLICNENKICGVRHFSAVTNRLGAVRLEEKENRFLLKSNSLKPQAYSDKSPYSRLC
jgi:hypothetical protein